MKYVMDSFAWIEYFLGSEKGFKIKKIVESHSDELFTSKVSIAEICSFLKREKGEVEKKYLDIFNSSNIHYINNEFAKEAGILHAEIRKKIKDFRLVNSFILLTARKLGARVITGDPHFKGFKETILI
jgi:predicted nucleic acid-binding protein